MHTIELHIDDSIFEKFMGLIEILPKDKVEVTTKNEYPSISFEEAKAKVQRAQSNIDHNRALPLSEAIDKILGS